jgi:hypothetical protein
MTIERTCKKYGDIIPKRPKKYTYSGKHLGTGNRCGHDPANPSWTPLKDRKTKKNEPKTQSKLMESALDYYYIPEILPTLRNLNGNLNKNGAPRKNRSDGRHPETLILVSILSFLEYASLRVGTPLPNGMFKHRSCGEIAKRAGMMKAGCDENYPRPNKRFWRAWNRLKMAGAFNVHKQYEEVSTGKKRARNAIKSVNLDFLISLGGVSYAEMKRFRKTCSDRIQEVRDAYDQKNTAAVDALEAKRSMQRQVQGVDIELSSPYTQEREIEYPDKARKGREHYNRQRLAYQKELLEAPSRLSFAQISKRVDRLYPLGNGWKKEKAPPS